MPVRMTGMISGLDTDTLIQSMVDAQRLKNKRVEDKKTLLEWKQDRWKELNAKLYKLYTTDLNKMRLQSSYLTKAVTSSNENLLSVNATANAPVGSHSLEIISLASSQYVTSEVIEAPDETIKVTSNTKLKDLGIDVNTLINITNNNKETKTLEVTETTTIADFVNFAKSAGYTANFDTNYKRLYISSKSSGTANAFQITATTSTATVPKNEILNLVGYNNLTTEEKKSVDEAIAALASSTEGDEESKTAIQTLKDLAEKEAKRIIASNVDAQIRAEVTPDAKEAEENKIKQEVLDAELGKLGITKEELTDEQRADIEALQVEKIKASSGRINAAIEDAVSEAIALEKAKEGENRYKEAEEDNQQDITDAMELVSERAKSYQAESKKEQTDVSSVLNKLGLGDAATVVEAKDSKIKYNDVEYTGTSNVININGLELTLKGAAVGETININVTNNSKGVYDMVKNFVSSYNDILKEMNDLYYAESARDYKPLSDDEKEAMTEDQIEKWEKKIKDSILRRDSSLGSLLDSMKNAMMTSVEVDGKRYSLSSFGIKTSTVYTEKGLLHIDGNEDDALFASFENKLMKALEEDPDTVMNVLSQISQKLYDTMNEKMKAIPNVRSALTFYNDKLMSKQKTDYDKQIAKLEAKVLAMEEKYYKQFAAMETALAKMQEQSNALAGMLGISNK